MERLSIEQLKEEAQLLHLPITGDKKSLIEAILAHWEKNETAGYRRGGIAHGRSIINGLVFG